MQSPLVACAIHTHPGCGCQPCKLERLNALKHLRDKILADIDQATGLAALIAGDVLSIRTNQVTGEIFAVEVIGGLLLVDHALVTGLTAGGTRLWQRLSEGSRGKYHPQRYQTC